MIGKIIDTITKGKQSVDDVIANPFNFCDSECKLISNYAASLISGAQFVLSSASHDLDGYMTPTVITNACEIMLNDYRDGSASDAFTYNDVVSSILPSIRRSKWRLPTVDEITNLYNLLYDTSKPLSKQKYVDVLGLCKDMNSFDRNFCRALWVKCPDGIKLFRCYEDLHTTVMKSEGNDLYYAYPLRLVYHQ